MQITVHYMAQLKRLAGVAKESIDVPTPPTLKALLSSLAERHDEALARALLDDAGRPQHALLVFHGDEQIRDDFTRALSDGDELTLLTPMAGG